MTKAKGQRPNQTRIRHAHLPTGHLDLTHSSLRFFIRLSSFGLFLAFGLCHLALSAEPMAVKVVVLAMFEPGEDEGDFPGEYQHWVERRHLDTVIPLPAGYHDLRTDGKGVIATVTGVGTARAAASVMALGLDRRFDFSHAYWLVAGIAGINPNRGSIGSAVWADYVVDGDLAYELDARQVPAGWSTGIIPLDRLEPFAAPPKGSGAECYPLNADLTRWAFDLTKGVPLDDDESLRKNRERYAAVSPPGAEPPKVLLGATLSSSRFWHGALMNRWADAWVRYWTEGRGAYTTTAMEDSGTLRSLDFLAKAGRVDRRRVLVLRTASNFDSEPPGKTALENLTDETVHTYSAYGPSLEAAFRVGNKVVDELLNGWAKYEVDLPQPTP